MPNSVLIDLCFKGVLFTGVLYQAHSFFMSYGLSFLKSSWQEKHDTTVNFTDSITNAEKNIVQKELSLVQLQKELKVLEEKVRTWLKTIEKEELEKNENLLLQQKKFQTESIEKIVNHNLLAQEKELLKTIYDKIPHLLLENNQELVNAFHKKQFSRWASSDTEEEQ